MANVRITNSMLVNNFLNNMNKNLNNMNKLQSQMAANRRIVNIYDDPVGVITSMKTRASLKEIETYSSNLDTARSWIYGSEDAVKALNEVVKSAYETAVNQASDPGNDASSDNGASGREAVAPYILQLRDEVFNIANTRLGDKYLFGGYNTTTQPFTVRAEEEEELQYTYFYDNNLEYEDRYGDDVEVVNEAINLVRIPLMVRNPEEDDPEADDYYIQATRTKVNLFYNNNDLDLEAPSFNDLSFDDSFSDEYESEAGQLINYDVSFGYRATTNYTGFDLMTIRGYYEHVIPDPESQESGAETTVLEPFEKNIYEIFDDFHKSLLNNDQIGIARAVQELQSVQSHIVKLEADMGGRTSRLDIVEERLDDNKYLYTQMKSDVEDIDLAEIVMWYSMAESVYNAALYSGGRIIQPSLMDYLG